MKIFFKFLIYVFIGIFFLIGYLSFVGVETSKLNNVITKKVKKIDNNFNIELRKIRITLDPIKLRINVKTYGAILKNKDKILNLESISANISLRSYLNKDVSIENLDISTKYLEIKDLISFVRILNKDPELYLLEKFVKKGFITSNIILDFDKKGNIKNNYKISGVIKDAKINIFKKFKINDLNLNFIYKKDFLEFRNTNLSLNGLNLSLNSLAVENTNNDFLVKGEVENSDHDLSNQEIELLIKPYFPNFQIENLILKSENKFSFKINKKYQLKDFSLSSNIEIKELLFINKLKLENFLPNINKDIKLSNHKIKIDYKKKELTVSGNGDLLLQDELDKLSYSIFNKDKKTNFEIFVKIKKNPFEIDFLDYEKKEKNEMSIDLKGSSNNENILLNLISFKEENNYFRINNLLLNKKLIIDLSSIDINFLDKKNKINKLNMVSKKDTFYLKGSTFNANNLIKKLLSDDDKKFNIIKKKFKLDIDIAELFLDQHDSLKNFRGNLLIYNQDILNGNLEGNFSNNEKFIFTVKSNENDKITTLYMDKAKPMVDRYEFIKGFNEGKLDFYSSKNDDQTVSTLKIYDFKLKELPALTKVLTLASLQGIADLLSGEGIRFNEFEMNFKTQEDLMTIEEIYAIGPAISILMNGYIEKNKLVSLRGTLVPATTINKAIGSIPILGQILVGSKTGEGVFGVSFKIKGSPKNLETSVNPIKTLTPRFITRTLEKIKKN